MRSGNYGIAIENGSTFEMSLSMTQDDGAEYNLAGYSVDMQIRDAKGDLILDCESFISIEMPNKLNVEIPATATQPLPTQSGFYQIEVKIGTKEYSVLRGMAKLEGAVIK